MNVITRTALHRGKMAAVDHVLHGHPQPANPFRKGSKSQTYWAWGLEQGTRLCRQLLEHQP